MSDQPRPENHVSAIVTLVTVVAVLVTQAITGLSPLRSERPRTGQFSPRDAEGLQRAPSRLWMDPLASAYQAFKAEEDPRLSNYCAPSPAAPKGLKASITEIKTKLGSQPYKPQSPGEPKEKASDPELTLCLVVLLTGNPDPDSSEKRLQTRYAVISALGSQNLIAEESSLLGGFDLNLPAGPQAACKPALVAFEWFKKDRCLRAESKEENSEARPKRYDRALVLWLDESQVAGHSLAALAKLKAELHPESKPGGPTAEWRFLGPSSSDSFVHMLEENSAQIECQSPDGSKSQDGLSSALAGDILYSPWATIAHTEIKKYLNEKFISDPEIAAGDPKVYRKFTLKAFGISVERTGGTDKELAEVLRTELYLRHADPQDTGNHIALISEWDTAYGRGIVRTFAKDAGSEKAENGPAILPENISHYSYLRGVDGSLAERENPRAGASPPPSAKDSPQTRKTSEELPSGTGQLDYLRRLDRQLSARDRQLRRSGKGGLSAIGVLGGDVYDKLLILQALKRSFPNALFFTTDLDANLVHPRHYSFTRNLVIASHFALALPEKQQAAVAPFRDSYQTAVYWSCLKALGQPTSDYPEPRIFEVGRTRTQVLYIKREAADDQTQVAPKKGDPPRTFKKLGYQGSWFFEASWQQLAKAGGAILLAVMLCSPILALIASGVAFRRGPAKREKCRHPGKDGELTAAPKDREPAAGGTDEQPKTKSRRRKLPEDRIRLRIYKTFGILFILFIAVMYHDLISEMGEPFHWFEGLSVWPSLILWLVTCFLCVFFVYKMHFWMQAAAKELEDDFGLVEQSASANSNPSPARQRRSPKQKPATGDTPAQDAEETLSGLFYKLWIKIRHPESGMLAHAYNLIWPYHSRLEPGKPPQKGSPGTGATIQANDLWEEYRNEICFRKTLVRITPLTVLAILLIWCLYGLSSRNLAISRGFIAYYLEGVLRAGVILLALGLSFYVLDMTIRGKRFLDALMDKSALWSAANYLAFDDQGSIADEGSRAAYMKVQAAAKLTVVLGRLIYFPFIVLLVILVSRHSTFDAWTWPFAVIGAIIIIFVPPVVCEFALRQGCDRIREAKLRELKQARLRCLAGDPKSKKCAQIDALIQDVASFRQGAFSGFFESSLVRAALIPMSGMATLGMPRLISMILGG